MAPDTKELGAPLAPIENWVAPCPGPVQAGVPRSLLTCIGHSLGGATCIAALEEDRRFGAAGLFVSAILTGGVVEEILSTL
jgi:hypothetical protein